MASNDWEQLAEFQRLIGDGTGTPMPIVVVRSEAEGPETETETEPEIEPETDLTGESSMPAADLTGALRTLLADTVTVYFRAHGYHWNVEGEDFSQYHALFAEIYSDVYDAIDPLAENIRKLDAYAPFTLPGFIAARTIDDTKVSPTPREMARDLLEANAAYLVGLNACFAAANDANQQGIANFLAERIDMHQKWAWQLRSSVK